MTQSIAYVWSIQFKNGKSDKAYVQKLQISKFKISYKTESNALLTLKIQK